MNGSTPGNPRLQKWVLRIMALVALPTVAAVFAPRLTVHLGKLARWLRLLGFDVLYRNDFADAEIAALSAKEKRIVLTRDRRLLHRKTIDHGYWVRSVAPEVQIVEVLRRFQLEGSIQPFQRCLECNGPIHAVDKAEVWERLKPKTRLYYERFFQCTECGKVYWEGSHYEGMVAKLAGFLDSQGFATNHRGIDGEHRSSVELQ